jgi:hypothetical protein
MALQNFFLNCDFAPDDVRYFCQVIANDFNSSSNFINLEILFVELFFNLIKIFLIIKVKPNFDPGKIPELECINY